MSMQEYQQDFATYFHKLISINEAIKSQFEIETRVVNFMFSFGQTEDSIDFSINPPNTELESLSNRGYKHSNLPQQSQCFIRQDDNEQQGFFLRHDQNPELQYISPFQGYSSFFKQNYQQYRQKYAVEQPTWNNKDVSDLLFHIWHYMPVDLKLKMLKRFSRQKQIREYRINKSETMMNRLKQRDAKMEQHQRRREMKLQKIDMLNRLNHQV